MPTNEFHLTRRAMLLGLGAAAAVLALGVPAPARALTTSAAQSFVVGLAGELTALIDSGRGDAQMYSAFEGILARYADMGAIAASTLGPPWRSASAAQKQGFVAAFQRYLSRRYGKQFRDYKNARIDVTGAKDGGKAGILVQTKVVRPGDEDIAVEWQVSDRSGAAKVVNLIIEGVSMLANERAEVGAMLDAQRGSLDALIAQLKTAA